MSAFGFVLHDGLTADAVVDTLEWLADRSHVVRLPALYADGIGRP